MSTNTQCVAGRWPRTVNAALSLPASRPGTSRPSEEEPGLVTLEGLVGFLGRGGFKGIMAAHSVATYAPVQPRSRDLRAQELAHDRQQIIERHQQGAPEMHDRELLRNGCLGLRTVRSVETIAKDLSLLKSVDSVCSVMLKRWARILAGSALAAVSARTAGVVRTLLGRGISMDWDARGIAAIP